MHYHPHRFNADFEKLQLLVVLILVGHLYIFIANNFNKTT